MAACFGFVHGHWDLMEKSQRAHNGDVPRSSGPVIGTHPLDHRSNKLSACFKQKCPHMQSVSISVCYTLMFEIFMCRNQVWSVYLDFAWLLGSGPETAHKLQNLTLQGQMYYIRYVRFTSRELQVIEVPLLLSKLSMLSQVCQNIDNIGSKEAIYSYGSLSVVAIW